MTREHLIVQKYGGSSLDSPDRIREVAENIAARADDRAQIIVIVSAMGRTTDELVKLAHEVTPRPQQRELDMLLTVGERISMSLMSMALNSLGCRAISFTGSQGGIVTNTSHSRAVIEEIRAERISTSLDEGKLVIVAGFQGVSRTREITTLGRGGSDTTAVALAATLGAASCEIYSDFPGVYTADPRFVRSARRIPSISYDEMLELAVRGAKVLHYRAAEIARRYRVPLRLLSSFEKGEGTEVCEGATMEYPKATSITFKPRTALYRLTGPSKADAFASLLTRVAKTDLQVITCHKESSSEGSRLTVLLERDDADAFDKIVQEINQDSVHIDRRDDLATVSVVGSGFACNPRVVWEVERLLNEAGIATHLIMTSSLSVTCLLPEKECERAVDLLHSELFNSA
jgi:aspartate kinase